MKITVKNLSNKDVKEIDLPEAIFGYPYKEHLIHATVVANLAAKRSGTHSTKTRSDVRGGGRKPWRQKGTGRARAGSTRSPLWRAGGTVHGPQPRSYDQKLSARERRNALKSALSKRIEESGFHVLENLELANHRTTELQSHLVGLGLDGKVLIVDDWNNDNLALAARNNPRLKVVDAHAVQVYDVVDRGHVVFSEAALNRIVEVLSK